MRRFLLFGAVLSISIPARAACEISGPSFSAQPRTLVDSQRAPRAWILLGHGLNNPPEVMDPLARDLCARGFDIFFLQLRGHDPRHPDREIRRVTANDWRQDLRRDLAATVLRARTAHVPVGFVGYSLSSLVFEDFMASVDEAAGSGSGKGKGTGSGTGANAGAGNDLVRAARQEIRGAVHIALPLELRWYARLLRYLPISNFGILPSRNRPDARANSGTSMSAYRALFTLRDHVLAFLRRAPQARGSAAQNEPPSFPRRAFFVRNDELVDTKESLRFLERANRPRVQNWRASEVQKTPAGRAHSHHHFFVSALSAGDAPYKQMLDEMDLFWRTALRPIPGPGGTARD